MYYRTRGYVLKKRTFFGARSAPVTGIDVCTEHANIAKTTQHHEFSPRCLIFGLHIMYSYVVCFTKIRDIDGSIFFKRVYFAPDM